MVQWFSLISSINVSINKEYLLNHGWVLVWKCHKLEHKCYRCLNFQPPDLLFLDTCSKGLRSYQWYNRSTGWSLHWFHLSSKHESINSHKSLWYLYCHLSRHFQSAPQIENCIQTSANWKQVILKCKGNFMFELTAMPLRFECFIWFLVHCRDSVSKLRHIMTRIAFSCNIEISVFVLRESF